MEKTVYFDNAATTFPKPEEVYLSTDKCFREYCVNVGRGQHKLSSFASNVVSETRELLLGLFHSDNKQIVFTHTATEALNLLLNNTLQEGITVYISPFEHNAVTRVIEHYKITRKLKIKILPFMTKSWSYDLDKMKQMFEEAPPNLVVVSHASNVCGYISPVSEICSEAKKYNCISIVDMCQTAGLVDISLASDNIDFAVFDGHKTLYAPLGVAGIVGKNISSFEPLIYGGTGVESMSQNMPSSSPERFEAGSHNIIAISGLNAAIKWINKIGIDSLMAKERENRKRLIGILQQYENIEVLSPLEEEKSVGIVSCVFKGYSSDNIGNVLSKNNIAVRTGLHCAPLAHQTLGTFPAGTVRLSTSWFTKEEDFVELEKALNFIEENS